jgi:hypothetical protein
MVVTKTSGRKNLEAPQPTIEAEEPIRKTITLSRKFFSSSVVIGVVVVILLTAFAAYSQAKLRSTRNQLRQSNTRLAAIQSDPQIQASLEIDQLVNQVGQLITLPSGEQPTVATVTDLSQLQNQPFFTNAQVGDKVLIYSTAKEAILYRPSDNKIIEVAPLNNSDTAGVSSTSTTTNNSTTTSPKTSTVKK